MNSRIMRLLLLIILGEGYKFCCIGKRGEGLGKGYRCRKRGEGLGEGYRCRKRGEGLGEGYHCRK